MHLKVIQGYASKKLVCKMLSVLSNHVWSFDCYEEIFQSISKQWGESENKIYNILAGGYELFFSALLTFCPFYYCVIFVYVPKFSLVSLLCCSSLSCVTTVVVLRPVSHHQRDIVSLFGVAAWIRHCIFRADSRFAPSQCETALLCNDVSHWLGAKLKSDLIL